MDDFVNLHLHSDHSALDGIIKIPDLMQYVHEIGQPAVGISDHGTISGTYEFLKEGKAAGINAVPGMEAYVDDLFVGRDDKERTYFHTCIWALDDDALADLVRISSASYRFNFYYKPRLNKEMIEDLGKRLVCTSGCLSGQFAKLTLAGDFIGAERLIETLKRHFAQVYMEIQALIPKESEEGQRVYENQKLVNDFAIQIAKGHNLPILATNDSHYLKKDDWASHDVWCALQSRKTILDEKRFKFDVVDVHCRTRNEMELAFSNYYPSISPEVVKSSLDTSVEIGQANKVHGYKTFTSLTPKLLPEDEAFKYLCELAAEGYRRLITKESYQRYAEKKGVTVEEAERIYKERFEYELQQIQKQGFVDYFLLVHELLDWCEQNGIYRGAARGSAASSLISYLVGITKVIDPLYHDLIFERFIAPDRIYQPDIDLDFAAAQRDQVIRHLIDRWGDKNVSMIGTYIKEKGKLVLGDIARAYQLPSYDVQKVKEVVIQRPTGDARASETLEETFETFKEARDFNIKYPFVFPMAITLEGCVRGFGQHAAGVLITPDKLENYVPIERRKDVITCAFDGLAVEKMGFLKLDILGIDVLDLLRNVREMVKETRGIDVDYWNLPLDDALTLSAFNDGDLLGVFQFQKSLGMVNICRAAPIERFDDIVHLNSLYRPGGMRSGAAMEYLSNRAGRSETKSVHPVYDKITEDTYGIIVYQEQIMQMFSKLAGFPATRVDEGRKLISKSHGVDAFDRLYPEFRDGCLKNNISEDLAREFFGRMRHSGSYCFNRSHAVAYSLLSYYSQYMKVHFPQEFFTCYLNGEEDEDLIKQAIRYWMKKGEFRPLNINKSEYTYSVDGDYIRAGFNKLKWCSPAATEQIRTLRPFKSYEEFCERTPKRIVNSKVKKNLLIAGAFDELEGKDYVLNLLQMTEAERELESAEIYPSFSGVNKLDLYADVIDNISKTIKLVPISALRSSYNGLFHVAGVVSETRFNRVGDFDKEKKSDEDKDRVRQQYGWIWGARFIDFDIDDGTEHIRLRIQPDFYDECGDHFRNGAAILVRGIFRQKFVRSGDKETGTGGIGIVTGVETLDNLRANTASTPFGMSLISKQYFMQPNNLEPITEAESGGDFYGTLIGWKNFLRKKDDARYSVLEFQVGSSLRYAVLWAKYYAQYSHLLEREAMYRVSCWYNEEQMFETHLSIKSLKKLKLK